MNLIESKTYSDKLEALNLIDFEELVFKTKEDFINLILDIIEELTFSDIYDEKATIKLYNYCNTIDSIDRISVVSYMISIGYGNSYYFVKSLNIKIEKSLLDEIITNLEHNFKKMDFEDKLNVISSNNWVKLFNYISNNPKYYIDKIEDILLFNDDEMLYLYSLKSSSEFNNIFNERIEQVNKFNFNQNFGLKSFYKNNKSDNISDIIMQINLSKNNYEFKIDFINFSGFLTQIIITDKNDKYINCDYVFTKKEYFKYFKGLLESYLHNYNHNLIDFVMLFSKYNQNGGGGGGGKDLKEYKKLKIAA